MADRDGIIRFYTADPRGIIPLDEGFHIPATLRQLLKKDPLRSGSITTFPPPWRLHGGAGGWHLDQRGANRRLLAPARAGLRPQR